MAGGYRSLPLSPRMPVLSHQCGPPPDPPHTGAPQGLRRRDGAQTPRASDHQSVVSLAGILRCESGPPHPGSCCARDVVHQVHHGCQCRRCRHVVQNPMSSPQPCRLGRHYSLSAEGYVGSGMWRTFSLQNGSASSVASSMLEGGRGRWSRSVGGASCWGKSDRASELLRAGQWPRFGPQYKTSNRWHASMAIQDRLGHVSLVQSGFVRTRGLFRQARTSRIETR